MSIEQALQCRYHFFILTTAWHDVDVDSLMQIHHIAFYAHRALGATGGCSRMMPTFKLHYSVRSNSIHIRLFFKPVRFCWICQFIKINKILSRRDSAQEDTSAKNNKNCACRSAAIAIALWMELADRRKPSRIDWLSFSSFFSNWIRACLQDVNRTQLH